MKTPRKPRNSKWAQIDDSGERDRVAWVCCYPLSPDDALALANWLVKFAAWASLDRSAK